MRIQSSAGPWQSSPARALWRGPGATRYCAVGLQPEVGPVRGIALALPAGEDTRAGERALALWHALLAAERGRFALWLPVFMGAGDALYFTLRAEPPGWLGAAAFAAAFAAWLLLGARPIARAGAAAVAAAALGFAAAELAAARAPALPDLPTHAVTLTGTVVAVEPLPAGRRVTIGGAQLTEGAPALARSLRIRLRTEDETALATGDRLRLRAMVRPPPPPAYPGAWDLQRDAYFGRIGGYGYALGPAERLSSGGTEGWAARVQALREAIAARVGAVLPNARGSIATTLLTGFTAGIAPADRAAFRDSGLAHLLAIAGLHIGIVMGLLMGAARLALAAWEHAALRWPTKPIAALVALAGGGFYMVLTGMHVPILRSFAMASLFTLALLAGRRAVSLRGLALAMATVLLLEPAEITGVSFQMSFSAVLALIAGYERMRPALIRLHGNGHPGRRFLLHLAGLALTSLLAGSASAPFAAYHFGQIQLYFIIANMIAVPLTALWVMPAGMVALALMPFGLERLALVPMGWGVEAVLFVARTVSALPVATLKVPHLPLTGLCLLALGMAWLGLWRSRLRLVGVPLILAGLATPLLVRPPDLLVSADARLIALRAPGAVYVAAAPGAARFTLESFEQFWAAGRARPISVGASEAPDAIRCTAESCLLRARPGGPAALLVTGEGQVTGCDEAMVMLSAERARGRCLDPPPWPRLIDRITVWRQGAQAIWLDPAGLRVLTDRAWRGNRPWVPPEPVWRRRAYPPRRPFGAVSSDAAAPPAAPAP